MMIQIIPEALLELSAVSQAIAESALAHVVRPVEVMVRCLTCGEYRLGTLAVPQPAGRHSVFGLCLRCEVVL